MTILKKWTILFFLFSFSLNSFSSNSAERIYAMYSSSVVLIENNLKGFGTGFLIRPNVIATNRHVIFGYELRENDFLAPKKITLKNKQVINSYSSVICSKSADLCFIILGQNVNFENQLVLSQRDVKPGEDLFVIGHPAGVSVPIISSGIISSEQSNMPGWDATGKPNEFLGFSITAAISPGSSGSPVISKNGELLGVAVSIMKESQNLNLVIGAKEIKNVMNDLMSKKQIDSFALDYGYEKEMKTRLSAHTKSIQDVQEVSKDNKKGEVDPNLIRGILLENLPKFRYCYQKYIDKSGIEVSGYANLSFTIGRSGSVTSTKIEADSIPVEVKSCVASIVQDIVFPRLKGDGPVEVKQPINFYPKQQ